MPVLAGGYLRERGVDLTHVLEHSWKHALVYFLTIIHMYVGNIAVHNVKKLVKRIMHGSVTL